MSTSFPIICDVAFFKHEIFRKKPCTVPPRSFSSLSFRIGGKISVSATDASFISQKNTLTYVPRGCEYSTEILEDGEMYVLHFWETADSSPFGTKPQCVEVPFSDTFENLFQRALRHSRNEQNPYAPMADAYRLLSEAAPLFFGNPPLPSPKMEACKQYLDNRICDPDLRVSELALQYGCSEVYFRGEFRKYYGASPIEYIKKRRLEIACRLLQTNLYSVAEVATRSGFDSISYFSAEFRRTMGFSPMEYRKM